MNTIAEPTTQRLPEADRLRALQAFNARLVCMTIDDSSYQEVVNGVWKVIGSDTCALFLKDPDSDSLLLKACEGYENLKPGLAIPLGDVDSIQVQVFNEEYMVNLQDLNDQHGIKPLSDKLRSTLVMPIISNSGPVGVFDFGSYEPAAFDPADIGMCSMLVDQMAFSLENIRLVNELSSSRDAVIRGMALLAEVRDSHISGHLSRICAYSKYLSEKLLDRPGYNEVNQVFIDTIARAAALHDIGKVGIPDAILLKPGKLTKAEFEVMKSHTTMGADLLQGLMKNYGEYTMINMGAEMAIGHHEWWNGNGYPNQLSGRDIPLSARVLALADVYDALTSRRVYKDAWTPEETMKTIRDSAGKQFDPELVEIFLACPEDLQLIQDENPD